MANVIIHTTVCLDVRVPDEHISFWLKEVQTERNVNYTCSRSHCQQTCHCCADIFFFHEASLCCPLFELFNACLISPEEPEHSLCGS